MVKSGFIREEELHRLTIPTVARSKEDMLAPFGTDGKFGGLMVDEIEIFCGEDHFWTEYDQHGDAQVFSAKWTAFSRASVFPTLAEGLNGGGTSRVTQFMDQLETETAARLAKKPERMLIPLGKVLLAKAEYREPAAPPILRAALRWAPRMRHAEPASIPPTERREAEYSS